MTDRPGIEEPRITSVPTIAKTHEKAKANLAENRKRREVLQRQIRWPSLKGKIEPGGFSSSKIAVPEGHVPAAERRNLKVFAKAAKVVGGTKVPATEVLPMAKRIAYGSGKPEKTPVGIRKRTSPQTLETREELPPAIPGELSELANEMIERTVGNKTPATRIKN